MSEKTYDSRFAPKFVVRLRDEEQRAAIEALANEQACSMNAIIIQAIEEKLGRGKALDLVLTLAREHLELLP